MTIGPSGQSIFVAVLNQSLRLGLETEGLAYFSNGSAATLFELVNYYDQRYAIGLLDQDKQDLVNLLSVF